MRLKDIDEEFGKRLTDTRTFGLTLGGDPEFFVAEKKAGKILPSDRFFPHKNDPLTVYDGSGYSKLFFDGIQGEMNPSYSSCREILIGNLKKLMKESYNIIGKENTLVFKPSVKVLKSVLNTAHPDAKVFGCMPDFNAYTLSTNTPPMDASKYFFRFAGGHMHFGIGNSVTRGKEFDLMRIPENHIKIIKFLDVLVGAVSVLFDNGTDAKRRREKYGTAGCFRPTPYGIEYRTPSCWWLKSPIFTSLVYGLAKVAFMLLYNDLDTEFRKHVGADEEGIRGMIDESDTKEIKKYWEKLRPYLAIAGCRPSNPLHIDSGMYNDKRVGRCTTPSFNGGSIKTKNTNRFSFIKENANGNAVFVLPAFDYMLTNGIDSVIDQNAAVEWLSADVGNGIITGLSKKLRDNKDYYKYQSVYYDQIL